MIDIYNLIAFLAPILTFISILALWFKSPRFRLWLLSLSKRFDKPRIGEQCAIFMEPRIKALNTENTEAFLPLVKLEFTKGPFEKTELDPDDNVVIVLRDSKNEAENLLRIAERYVSKGVMPRGRRLVNDIIKRAVDVTLIFRLLSKIDESLRLWDERHYQPCLDNPEMRETLEKVHFIDIHGGYLTRMFLPQLELISLREGPTINPALVDEAEAWLQNLHALSLKHHDDPEIFKKDLGELTFVQDNFGVQVVNVAATRLIEISGIERHKRRVLMALANPSIDFVYIVAWGETNCFHGVRLVGETYLDSRISEIWATFYRTRSHGKEFRPIVLVRYNKGPRENQEKKKKTFNVFQKRVRKELKKVRVTPERLIAWIEEDGELYLGEKCQLSRDDAFEIAKTMNNGDMTMDVLPYLFENEDLNLRYKELLRENNTETLSNKDKIIYRIHALLEEDDSKILPFLDPKVFMTRKKQRT